MAVSLSAADTKTMERRRRVHLDLADDFLRLPNQIPISRSGGGSTGPPPTGHLSQEQIERIDEQAAYALHQQLNIGPGLGTVPAHHHGAMGLGSGQNIRGRLLISVMQAKLVKNYGMTRMDPYVRISVGHSIYETPTDVNGSKTPRWNKTIQCFLPTGIHQIYLEIYDECSFSVDELVAHAYIQIPEEIFKGETVEEWYNLSGKQGDAKEGQILLVFSFMATPAGSMAPPHPVSYIPPGMAVHHSGKKQPMVYQSGQPVQTAVLPPVQQPQPTFSADDYAQLIEMFPNMDDEVVRSVYEVAGFSKDSAVNALLRMSE